MNLGAPTAMRSMTCLVQGIYRPSGSSDTQRVCDGRFVEASVVCHSLITNARGPSLVSRMQVLACTSMALSVKQ